MLRFHCQPETEEAGELVEFRLIYEGPLDPQTSQSRVEEKHAIRRALHPQLKELWNQFPFLHRNLDYYADQYHRDGFRFIPLVSARQARFCTLDILFLRRDMPGNLIANGGDIDNRIKVLFDGLRITRNREELGGATPQVDEDPFFCLLEDDSLITEVKITTDRILRPVGAGNIHDVVLIIHVKTGVKTGAVDMDEVFG